MELRSLKYLIAVAGAGSISRAAQELHMTQPPLSAAIAQLEQELGSRLFHRTSRGVTLTATGQYLLREAERILEAVDEATYRVRSLEQGNEGLVTLGVMPAASWEFIPAILSDFSARAPGVDIRLREHASGEVPELTANGKLDLGFVVTSSAERLQQRHSGVLQVERLTSVDIIIALGSRFRDAPDPISLRELIDIPFALPMHTSEVLSLREATLQAFEHNGLPLPRVLDTLTLQESLPLIISGIAAAAVPATIRRIVSDEVVLKNLEAGPAPFDLAVVYQDEYSLSPAAQRFLNSARNVGGRLEEIRSR